MENRKEDQNAVKSKYQESIVNIEVTCQKCKQTGIVSRFGLPIPFLNWLFSYYCCQYCGSKNINVNLPKYIKNDKNDTYHCLLNIINSEITRYRDYEWKIIIWSISLSWAIFLFSVTKLTDLFNQSFLLFAHSFSIIIIIIGTFLLSSHLLFIHEELTKNRNWRRQIERFLGLYDAPTILPLKWKYQLVHYSQGRDTFVIPFLLFMFITSLSLSYGLAMQHPIPVFIANKSKICVNIWCWFVPVLIGFLSVLEVIYVIYAVSAKGSLKRGSY